MEKCFIAIELSLGMEVTMLISFYDLGVKSTAVAPYFLY